MLLSLANFNNSAAHSRTCEMLPGELSMASVMMVCMESMTTNCGCSLRTCRKIWSSEVSHTTMQDERDKNPSRPSAFPPALGTKRSARNFNCRALSSPLT